MDFKGRGHSSNCNRLFLRGFIATDERDAIRIYANVQGKALEMNDDHLKPFQPEEVWNAVKSMSPLKASGTDDYPALFCHKYWYVVRPELTEYCLKVLCGSSLVEDIN